METTVRNISSVPAGVRERVALLLGGAAALLASACCLGPLVLLLLGVSGAWIGNLAALEPYRPAFVALALLCLTLAWRPVYRRAAACSPGDVCASPMMRTGYKAAFWAVALLVLLALGYPWLLPMFY